MDSIRLSQINEALNYDKNINGMVWNLEKKRTAAFPDPEVLPYSQLGEETMTTTKEGSNSLKVLLDAKIASVAQLNRQVQVDGNYPSAADDIGQVQPVVQAYNQVVAPFMSTQLTQQTRDAILTEMRYLLDRLGKLRKGLGDALDHRNLNANAVQNCVVALAVFIIMDDQIKTAKLLPISDNDVNQKVADLLERRPRWRAALGDRRPPFFPPGGGGPGGGPPPGGPGGAPPPGGNPPGSGPRPSTRPAPPPPPPGPGPSNGGPPIGPLAPLPPRRRATAQDFANAVMAHSRGENPFGPVPATVAPTSQPAAPPSTQQYDIFTPRPSQVDNGYHTATEGEEVPDTSSAVRPAWMPSDSDSDRFSDPFNATPSRPSVSSEEEPAAAEEQQSSAEEVDSNANALAQIGKSELVAVRKTALELYDKHILTVARQVVKSKSEKEFSIVPGGKVIVMSHALAQWFVKNTHKGFIVGCVLGWLLSGYAPISEGWFEWMGHGAVKNWKWLWGTTSWYDTYKVLMTQFRDASKMGVNFGLGEMGLRQIMGIMHEFYFAIGRVTHRPISDFPLLAGITNDAQEASESESTAERNDHMRKVQAFMNRLSPQVREEFLAKVRSRGPRRRALEAPMQQQKALPWGLNQVALPASSSTATKEQLLKKIQVQRRRRAQRDAYSGDVSSSEGGAKALAPQPTLVNYHPGVRQSKKGGRATIKGMEPILEHNEMADDPYVIRQPIQ